MSRTTVFGLLLLALTVGTGVAVSAFGFAYGGRQSVPTYGPPTPPVPPTPVPYGAMAVDAIGEDTGTSDPVDASRQVSVGDAFKISIHLTDPGDAGYIGYRVVLLWNDPLLDYIAAAQPVLENVWPTPNLYCSRAVRPVSVGLITECFDSDAVVSTYTGPLAQFEFLCKAEGVSQLALVKSSPGTALLDLPFTSRQPAMTSAQVTCVAPTPAPTPTPCTFVDSTPVPCTPTATPSPTVTPTPVSPSPAAMAVDAIGEATAASDPVDASRDVRVGETFKVTAHVTGTGEEGYLAYQVGLLWDEPILDYAPTEFRSQENVWPAPGGSCWPLRSIMPPDDDLGKEASLVFACSGGGPGVEPSFYTGPVAQFEFVCERVGTSQLTPLTELPMGTRLVDPRGALMDTAVTDAEVRCLGPAPTSTPTPSPAPARACADVTGDGRVNHRDVVALALRLRAEDGGPGYEVGFDLNRDGRIDALDLRILTRHLGEQC